MRPIGWQRIHITAETAKPKFVERGQKSHSKEWLFDAYFSQKVMHRALLDIIPTAWYSTGRFNLNGKAVITMDLRHLWDADEHLIHEVKNINCQRSRVTLKQLYEHLRKTQNA